MTIVKTYFIRMSYFEITIVDFIALSGVLFVAKDGISWQT